MENKQILSKGRTYAGIIKNDIAAAPGVCVSFFTQGCPFHCEECHNQETWDYNGGKPFTEETIDMVISSLTSNYVSRDLCIMGGEPLCPENLGVVYDLVKAVKEEKPKTKIYIWTGYTYDVLLEEAKSERILQEILDNTYCIIDGLYVKELRDITLHMRGSTNQQIIYLDN